MIQTWILMLGEKGLLHVLLTLLYRDMQIIN